jgi:Protein of unknown function (DUF1475)
MSSKHALIAVFASILVALLVATTWASTQQPVWEWQGLIDEPDRWWTLATLMDAYFGFLTFYVWVWFKEERALPRVMWFAAIMLLGNMAMATYVLLQLARVRPGEPVSAILSARRAA